MIVKLPVIYNLTDSGNSPVLGGVIAVTPDPCSLLADIATVWQKEKDIYFLWWRE